MKLLITIMILLCTVMHEHAQRAVCVVPVTDLVGAPLGTARHSAYAAYQALPIDGPEREVKRIGQLLYNEEVTIVPTHEPHGIDEIKIQNTSYFYCTQRDAKPQTTYWTLKKNVVMLDRLSDTRSIPEPIDYQKPLPRQNTVTLLAPWHDPISKRYYSAGTRFVLCATQPDPTQYSVYTLSPRLKTIKTSIAHDRALQPDTLSSEEKIAQFLEIIRWIANQTDGIIPYVWGGMSMNARYTHRAPTYIIHRAFNTSKPHAGPYSGLDCAGLFLRSLQMAGLPFFYKNTSAMNHYLAPLQPKDEIKNGDIIYTTGHVIAISDIAKNLVIEARTAQDGYGYVHECPLSEIIKEVSTIAELRAAYFNNQLITRIARNGNPIVHSNTTTRARTRVRILKLRSIFDKQNKAFLKQ